MGKECTFHWGLKGLHLLLSIALLAGCSEKRWPEVTRATLIGDRIDVVLDPGTMNNLGPVVVYLVSGLSAMDGDSVFFIQSGNVLIGNGAIEDSSGKRATIRCVTTRMQKYEARCKSDGLNVIEWESVKLKSPRLLELETNCMPAALVDRLRDGALYVLVAWHISGINEESADLSKTGCARVHVN